MENRNSYMENRNSYIKDKKMDCYGIKRKMLKVRVANEKTK